MRSKVDRSWLLAAVMFAAVASAMDRNVRDFGAVPDDGKDDTLAIRKAVVNLKDGDRLIFGKGQFDVTNWIVRITGKLKNVELDGRGAVLMVGGYDRHVRHPSPDFDLISIGGDNIKVHGFTVDENPSRNSVGQVIAIGDDYVDLKIYPEFLPMDGTEAITTAFRPGLINFRPDGTMDGAIFSYMEVRKKEMLRPDVLRIHPGRNVAEAHDRLSGLKPDDLVNIKHATGFRVVMFNGGQDFVLRDVTMHAGAHAVGVHRATGDVLLENIVMVPRPGSKRLLALNADNLNIGDCNARFVISKCRFEGNLDNFLDACPGFGYPVVESVNRDSRTVRFQKQGDLARYLKEGVTLEFYKVEAFRYLGRSVIKAVRQATSGWEATVDELPAEVAAGDFVETSSRMSTLLITGCEFNRARCQGLLTSWSQVTIENCKFRNVTRGPISICNDALTESKTSARRAKRPTVGRGPIRDIVIRNNLIEGCNAGCGFHVAPVRVLSEVAKYDLPPTGALRNVRIENNVIRGSFTGGIFASGVDGLVIIGNRIEGCNQQWLNTADFRKFQHVFWEPPRYLEMTGNKFAIYLRNCSNVQVYGNTQTGSPELFGESGCTNLVLSPASSTTEEVNP